MFFLQQRPTDTTESLSLLEISFEYMHKLFSYWNDQKRSYKIQYYFVNSGIYDIKESYKEGGKNKLSKAKD